MKNMKPDLPENYKPSVEEMERFLNSWRKKSRFSDPQSALDKLFQETYKKNECIEEVLIKCSAINTLDSTRIFDVYSMAKHICDLKIDKRLRQVDYSLVKDIADLELKEKKRSFYSFATKYCSHHLPDDYAVYDSYVEKALISINKKTQFANFSQEGLRDYNTFMNVIFSFRKEFNLTQYSIRQIDHYIWQLGRWFFNPDTTIFKYYHGEDESPFSRDDIRSKFWHGEMMYYTQSKHNSQFIDRCTEIGERWLQNANEQTKQFAEKYDPVQFGLIIYINELFAKWCPYDNLDWIFEY